MRRLLGDKKTKASTEGDGAFTPLADAPVVVGPLAGQALRAGTIRVGDALLAVGAICVQELRRHPHWARELFQTHLHPRPLRVWFVSRDTLLHRELSEDAAKAAHVPAALATLRWYLQPQPQQQKGTTTAAAAPAAPTPVAAIADKLMEMDTHALVEAVDALGALVVDVARSVHAHRLRRGRTTIVPTTHGKHGFRISDHANQPDL